MNLDDTTVWHDDGHIIWLELNKSELLVLGVNCPSSEMEPGACQHTRHGCIVEYFLMRYGLECNVGVCEPSGEVLVAWALIGDGYDLDECQCWVIPTTDDVFSMWAATQRGTAEEIVED